MLIKAFLFVLISTNLCHCAKLRKTPKVYNALITTDEELTPSKAYPLIQPVFQPIPLFSPLYPVSYADQFVPSNNNGENKDSLKAAERKFEPANPHEINEADAAEKPNDQNSALPLNEYGLPPSLIPVKNFPTYPYNIPFYYDSYGNYQAIQYPVLPPLDYYNPQQDRKLPPLEAPMFAIRPGARNLNPTPEEKSAQPTSVPSSPISSDSAIKNYANKNADIPDVEIPPLPVKVQ